MIILIIIALITGAMLGILAMCSFILDKEFDEKEGENNVDNNN